MNSALKVFEPYKSCDMYLFEWNMNGLYNETSELCGELHSTGKEKKWLRPTGGENIIFHINDAISEGKNLNIWKRGQVTDSVIYVQQ